MKSGVQPWIGCGVKAEWLAAGEWSAPLACATPLPSSWAIDGSRLVFRLSGTGTEGATLRVYLERYEPDPSRHEIPAPTALAPLAKAADALAGIGARLGRSEPTVVS